MHFIKLCLALALLALGILFASLNAHEVIVHYLVGARSLPLALLLFFAFALGIFLSVVLLGARILHLRAKIAWLTHQLRRARETTSLSEIH